MVLSSLINVVKPFPNCREYLTATPSGRPVEWHKLSRWAIFNDLSFNAKYCDQKEAKENREITFFYYNSIASYMIHSEMRMCNFENQGRYYVVQNQMFSIRVPVSDDWRILISFSKLVLNFESNINCSIKTWKNLITYIFTQSTQNN